MGNETDGVIYLQDSAGGAAGHLAKRFDVFSVRHVVGVRRAFLPGRIGAHGVQPRAVLARPRERADRA